MTDRRIAIFFTVVFVAFLSRVGNAQTEDLTPKGTVERWAEAWGSGSVAKLLSFYDDSKSLVAVASSGHSYRGVAKVRNMYEASFNEATWQRVTLEGLEIHEDGKFAWGVCRFTADFTPRGSNDQLVFTSQGSFVLRKIGGDWKIAMEHFSPIADVPRVQPRKD